MADLYLLAEGHTESLFADDKGPFLWPRCAIYGCPHYACLKEASVYCTPHTRMRDAGATFTEMQLAAPPPPPAEGEEK